MAKFEVTWKAVAYVEVEADNERDARRISRRHLDPDVDWDCEDIKFLGED
jgi:hypothetical protein